MEIEAKFSIAQAETFEHFRSATRLAGFSLGKERTDEIYDIYMDTTGRSILAGGYACRFRRETQGTRITLKGLGEASGAIHKREEIEILLPEPQPVEKWPPGPLRERILQLTSGEALVPLFEINQTRHVRPVRKHGQTIANLSLDLVRVEAGNVKQTYRELEVELTSQGSEDQLARIADLLRNKKGLQPEPASKFERGLKLLESNDDPPLLNPKIRGILAGLGECQDWDGLRSRALLAVDQGLSYLEVGKQVGRSARTIRRWVAEFRKSGLAAFPTSLPAEPPAQISPPQGNGTLAASVSATVPAIQLPDQMGLLAEDLIFEAVQKIVHFQFQHMLFHEAGTRLGQDIEELHDMRVAIRRIRAAIRVFGEYLNERSWSRFDRGLRRTGRALGKVRDLDVFWEKTLRYLDTLSPERKEELAPLQAVWEAAQAQARGELLVYLDGDPYRIFKETFQEFLEAKTENGIPSPGQTEAPKPRRLRHIAPVILFQSLAAMSAFEDWMNGPNIPLARLHQLRIASKRLRYALEFLEEVLGPESAGLIKEMKVLQDHLGALQDAVVASNLLRDFLTWGAWGHDQAAGSLPLPSTPVVAPGVAAYLAFRQAELQNLPAALPAIWARIQSLEFKRNILHALEIL